MLTAEDLKDWKPTQLLCKMQQLPGEKVDAMDPLFLRQLFLQCLLSNVRLILASAAKGTNLQELAESVMEVISLSIATVAEPQGPEFREFKAKWQA